jgi:hypothetical protein
MIEQITAWAVATEANGLLPATVRESKEAAIQAFLRRAPQSVWDFMRDAYGCRVVRVAVSTMENDQSFASGGTEA